MRPHTARLAQQFASDASSATITTEDTDDDAARKVCKVDQASGEALSDGVSGYLVNEGYITGLEGAMPGYIFSGVQQVRTYCVVVLCACCSWLTEFANVISFLCTVSVEPKQSSAQADGSVGTALQRTFTTHLCKQNQHHS